MLTLERDEPLPFNPASNAVPVTGGTEARRVQFRGRLPRTTLARAGRREVVHSTASPDARTNRARSE